MDSAAYIALFAMISGIVLGLGALFVELYKLRKHVNSRMDEMIKSAKKEGAQDEKDREKV